MKSAGLYGVVFVLSILGGCNEDARVSTLEARVKSLEGKNATLGSEIETLKSRASIDKLLMDINGIAYLTPGSDGYAVVKSDLGSLTVSLKNVQPYANGSKVTLQFGNLTSATIEGLKATLEWGPINSQGFPDEQQSKSKDVAFSQSLQSGGWTNTDVVLEAIPPAQLGFVRLRDVGHRGLRLRRP